MNDKIKDVIVTIVFLAIIIVFFIINIEKKDDVISISERRKLEQFPSFSVSKLFDGTFFEKFDKYTTDQFWKREDFRKLKISTEFNVFKKQDYNDMYVYDGYIIEQIYPLNSSSLNNFTNKLNYIHDRYLTENNKSYFTIVPDKNYFVDENNLKIDYTEMENTLTQNLKFAKYINIFDKLELSDYYKTDAHWKQENLLKVANEIAEKMNIDINLKYENVKVDNFEGGYSGRIPVDKQNDEIRILTNDILENCTVYNYETNKQTNIYDMTKKNGLDKYDVYLSGATSLMVIENPNSTEKRELIVFRDSFASSLIPLLVKSYSKITLVDTRYISPKILDRYIEFSNQDILFVYSTLIINNSVSLK